MLCSVCKLSLESHLAAFLFLLSCAGSGLLNSVEEAQAEADKVRHPYIKAGICLETIHH